MMNALKRTLCTLLSAALLAVSAPTVFAKSADFTDVPAKSWYAGAVDYVSEAGLFAGVGNGRFDPSGSMSRAMMVQVLANATDNYRKEDFTVGGFVGTGLNLFEPLPYDDVNEEKTWYGPPIRWATMYGMVSGKGNRRFVPFGAVTREETAVMLYRYAQKTENNVSHRGTSVKKFTDAGSISSWAKDAVDWAAENGILKGYPDGSLQPQRTITRSEAAMIFLNAKDAVKKRTAIYPMTDTAKKLGITADQYPTVDGSKLTQTLAETMYRAMHGINNPHGTQHSRTVPAYQNLINGKADLILVPDATAEILTEAEKAGVKLETYEIAKDGLVFVTPEENLAKDLTVEQLKQIYGSYSIKNWSSLGGGNKNLIPFCGKGSSDDRQMQLERLILGGTALDETIAQKYSFDSWNTVIFQTQNYHTGSIAGALENSYGLCPANYNLCAGSPYLVSGLKLLSVNGISPTRESIDDGKYPLTYRYYAVIRADEPADSPARKLAKWLQSEEGKELVSKAIG